MSTLFSIEDVHFSSSTAELLKGVSLEIKKGSVTELMGESGQGKSILLKVIGGILVPSKGKVLFEGKDLILMTEEQEREFRRRVSMVFQDGALWANQNIEQNLTLPLKTHFPKMKKPDILKRIAEVLKIVNYERPLSLRPAQLSLGEQKKVAFARAIILNPEVLLLDECTASLDTQAAAIIRKFLKKFVKQGNTIVYISHSATFKREFAGKRIVVSEGRIKSEVQNKIR